MVIEKIKIADLKPAEYNPRKDLQPGDPEYEKLKKSFLEFGYVEPIIFNRQTGNVVGGHQRLKVLQELGETEIDCVVVELSDDKEKLLNIALNKIQGKWDEDKLATLMAELDASAYDLSITGFDTAEIESLMEQFYSGEAVQDDFDVDKAKSEIESKGSFIRNGDIVMLGKNKLLCGDSTQTSDWEKLLQGEKPQLLVTSPPYSLSKQYGSHREGDDDESWLVMMKPVVRNITKFTGVAVLNIGDAFASKSQFIRPISLYAANMFADCGYRILYIRLWMKQGQNFSTMAHLSTLKPVQQTEWITAYSAEDEQPEAVEAEFNFITAFAGHAYKFVKRLTPEQRRAWGYSQAWSINTVRSNKDHPAQFHVELPWRVIVMHSDVGRIVMDCFSGSGTTMLACHQSNRIFYGIEKEETYVELTIRRYCDFTGSSEGVSVLRCGKQIPLSALESEVCA